MRQEKGIRWIIAMLGVLIMMLALPISGFGEVPQQISYQGFLTDDLGNPVSNDDYVMWFSIYDVATGGPALWWEEQTVTVTNGIYNVQIGQDPTGNPFPTDLFDGQRWLGVAVGADAEMTPRQPLTSVPYALQAGGTSAGAVTAIMLADEAVTETKVATGAITAEKIVGGTGSGVDADLLDGLDAASFAPTVHNHDAQYYSKAYVDALENAFETRIATLEAKLQYLSVVAGTVFGMPGPHVIITGANFHVRNGRGSTNTVNGLGNLIVGYNELRTAYNDRSGSHTVVVGQQNNYSSFGGIVAGMTNTVSGVFASVTGGSGNVASGGYSSVCGGGANTASGASSSVSGGSLNAANGDWASVSGGENNTASGLRSSVTGGYQNTASYTDAWAGGGYGNTASESYASVSGGRDNAADGYAASVSGGRFNRAYGNYSSVAGGGGDTSADSNRAYGNYSAVIGGRDNTAGEAGSTTLGLQATISGGAGNDAKGTAASVSGGYINHADGSHASISGGRYSTASGNYASVSGGRANVASGEESSISGGDQNTASSTRSSVTGGYLNSANGWWSSVSGGYQRTVDDQLDWQGGEYFSEQ